ncbi:HEPN domain-containing protein [Candidatus Woesearchaeota archaeon]|nr:HEPN domain-containing protein [Candidatus Woesearchaeota archaeon]
MKEFEFFLKKGEVKKQSPDINLSKAAFIDSVERINLAKNIFRKEKPKYVLENAYEAMREAADSLLYLNGFKSFSHEASIVYLMGRGFSESDIAEFDRLRKIRNSIKYYGENCDESEAKLAIEFAEKIIKKIEKLLK